MEKTNEDNEVLNTSGAFDTTKVSVCVTSVAMVTIIVAIVTDSEVRLLRHGECLQCISNQG